MRSISKSFRLGFVSSLIVLCFVFNGMRPGLSPAAELPALVLPLVLDLTGPYKNTCAPSLKVAKAAEMCINEGGGIRGRKVRIQPFDCRYDVGVSTSLLNKFISMDPKPLLIYGGIGPFVVAAIKKLPEPGYRIPMIGPTAYEFLVRPPSWFFAYGTLFAQSFTGFIDWKLKNWKENRPMKVAFFVTNTVGGKEALKVKAYLEKRNVKIVAEEYTDPFPVDLTPALLRFQMTKPDYIYGTAPLSALSKLMMDMNRMRIKSKLVLLGYIPFGLLQEVVDNDLLEGSYLTSGYNTYRDEKAPGIKVMNEYFKKYAPDLYPPNTLHMWPWVFAMLSKTILEKAYDKAGSWDKVTGEFIYEMLNNSKFSTGGVTSDLEFTPSRRVGNSAIKILEFKDGKEVDVSGWVPIPKDTLIE